MNNILVDSEIVMRPISTVRPYTRNPRTNDKTVELLTKLIPKVGFNVPIVIDERGIIVKGHARFIAAIRLGMTEVPCIISHADPEAIKADRIADNRISEFSEWITTDLMREINELEFDLSDIGLPKITLDDVASVEDVEKQLETEQEAVSETPVHFEEAESDTIDYEDPEYLELVKLISEPHYSVVCEKCGYHMIIPVDEI